MINERKTGALLSGHDELIEPFNPCAFAVDLSHEALVYRTIAGVVDITLVSLTGSLPAGGYRVYGGTAYTGAVSGTFDTDLPTLGGGIAIRDTNGIIYDSLGHGIAVNLFVEGAVSLQVPLGQTLAASPMAPIPTTTRRTSRSGLRRRAPRTSSAAPGACVGDP